MYWRNYHEATKHSPERLRRAPHFLDWASMPDPFRHYEGAPLLDLPADPPFPAIPALDVLTGGKSAPATAAGPAFLSQLLYHAAAISASKLVPSTGYRYALRVNPSSGNLHPTELHFITRGLPDWRDGLYHYRPSSHMAEQRMSGTLDSPAVPAAPLTFVLTSIAWREAWKYRDRAYRYCCHDIGHAWQALALSAQALGCETTACGQFDDDAIAHQLRLSPDEWPMLLIRFPGKAQPQPSRPAVWTEGLANPLSDAPIAYPSIDAIHQATKALRAHPQPENPAAPPPPGLRPLPTPAMSARPFAETVRARRSALDFTGAETTTPATLAALLNAATQPLHSDFTAHPRITVYLYLHRIHGLDPGLYRYWPPHGLELLRLGDQRVIAAGLSLGQNLAGNSCVTFSLAADMTRAAEAFGDRAYRYVHFEAGAIGHRLYLAATALGLGATGIGAFYDDEVHRYLALDPANSQVVYHFAVGHPVADPRVNA